jgi:peptidoglycan biosynthesis protein MviN/MurJ (putative lipid II flippase)
MVFGHLSLHLLSAHALLGRLVGITVAGATVRVGMLAVLIPTFGLTGAATGAAVAVVLEQALTVATALRRFQISGREIGRRIWRPALAAAAMALALCAEGPGSTDNPDPTGLIQAAIVGSLTYGVVLAGTWMLAGRPLGPESDVLALLRHTARR